MERAGIVPLRLLLTITDVDTERDLERLLKEAHLPIYYQCRAKGTAKKELLDICGLGGQSRLITMTVIPKLLVEQVFLDLSESLHINKRGHGIALTIPLTGIQESMRRVLNQEICDKIQEEMERDEKHMKQEAAFAMVLVSVKEGYSDEVIDAATKAGARGGSVIRGRRRGSQAAVQFFGISYQEEQEFVLIVIPKEKKPAVMQAISESCGLRSEAHGMVLSVPVDAVAGLVGE